MTKAKQARRVTVAVSKPKPTYTEPVTVRVMEAAVSRPALMARINRKLAQDGRRLLAARGARARQDLGAFYVIDANRNLMVDSNVDPAHLARELGVLQPWERPEGFGS